MDPSENESPAIDRVIKKKFRKKFRPSRPLGLLGLAGPIRTLSTVSQNVRRAQTDQKKGSVTSAVNHVTLNHDGISTFFVTGARCLMFGFGNEGLGMPLGSMK